MKSVENVEELIKRANAVPHAEMNRRILNDIFKAHEESKRATSATFEPKVWRMILRSKAGYLAAVLLVVFSWAACFVMSGKVKDLKEELEQARRDITFVPADDSATINFYLKKHQDVIARHAYISPVAPKPAQMRVSPQDILYYEIFDDGPEYISPGIIVRGPSSRHQISSSEVPVISNGYTLTLSEAQETTVFNLVAPPWLHPYYKLGQIRIIDGRDALQLLYTNGINSISLFEQSLDGQRGLSRQDFREYAVYNNQVQGGGTILAWRDETLSYVLIGNIEISQLMDMAQLISARK